MVCGYFFKVLLMCVCCGRLSFLAKGCVSGGDYKLIGKNHHNGVKDCCLGKF